MPRSQIQNPKTLESLIAVCRAFREIFTSFLYARRSLEITRWESAVLSRKGLPSTPEHTKELNIILTEDCFREMNEEVGTDWVDRYALFVNKMVMAMPNLRSFR